MTDDTEVLGSPKRDKGSDAGPSTRSASSRRRNTVADTLIGTVLADRYKLLDRIGEGAMGWVFIAEHTEIGKRVALKVLRPALCRLPEAVRRFRREARAATSVGSKHIVDVSDFGATDNGAAFMVMELLEGGEDLKTTLKREGALAWERVQHMVLQMCEALQAAHDAEIVHRDVKPANVYRLDVDGDPDFVKVLDFGIARLASPQDSIVTATGVVMGTPDFMAPEQAQGQRVDHRADIYSLGATAYALLAGRPPFVGANEYDVIYKQLNEEPKPPTVYSKREIPGWFEAVILRAMAKEPDERYATMTEFAAALRSPPQVDPEPEDADDQSVAVKAEARSAQATEPTEDAKPWPAWAAPVGFVAIGMAASGLLVAGYVALFG